MKKVIVTAPGKIIFSGEHSVVYGKRAISGAIKARIKVQATTEKESYLKIQLPNLKNPKETDLFFSISLEELELFLKDLKEPFDSDVTYKKIEKLIDVLVDHESCYLQILCSVTFIYLQILSSGGNFCSGGVFMKIISSDLPIGCGLGSSASLNVATAASFLVLSDLINPINSSENNFYFEEKSLDLINDAAFQMEKFFHGNPSGVDNSTCTYGGALSYKSGIITHLPKFRELQILVVNSGVTRNTKLLVMKVKQKQNQFPEVINPILDSMDAISCKIEEKLQIEDKDSEIFNDLQNLIEVNQHLLCSIGVGHPSLTSIYDIARRHGYACKLTGAGGGGCAIVLLGFQPDDEKVCRLQLDLKARGFCTFQATFGCPGVELVTWESDDVTNVES